MTKIFCSNNTCPFCWFPMPVRMFERLQGGSQADSAVRVPVGRWRIDIEAAMPSYIHAHHRALKLACLGELQWLRGNGAAMCASFMIYSIGCSIICTCPCIGNVDRHLCGCA